MNFSFQKIEEIYLCWAEIILGGKTSISLTLHFKIREHFVLTQSENLPLLHPSLNLPEVSVTQSVEWKFKFILQKIIVRTKLCMGLPKWTVVNNPPTSVADSRDVGSVPGSERFLGERNGNPLHYSCPGEFQGQRTLVGYRPWGHKESYTTGYTQTNYACI